MIGQILNNMFTRGLSIKRWSNFPRVEDINLMDNLGFVSHISLVLAQIEMDLGHDIDKEFLIKRNIFGVFIDLILSDINSGTKKYIKDIDPDIFKELEGEVLSYILHFDAPDYIKRDIVDTLNNTSNTKELEIIQASRRYARKLEALTNAKVYDGIYDDAMGEIDDAILEISKNLNSLKILLRDENYKKYLLHIRRLTHSIRWGAQVRKFKVSVISHLAITTFLTYILISVENNNGGKYDMKEGLLKAIFHDIPESITGDIISPTKRAIPGFEEIVGQAEVNMLNDTLLTYLPNEYREFISPYIFTPFDGDEGEIVKHRDILSAYFESRVEVNNGNTSYIDIDQNMTKKLSKIDTISVKYMLDDVVNSFDSMVSDIILGEY